MTSKHNGQAPAEHAGAIPADERMTPAELRVVLGWLGLSQRDAAALCGVEERSVRRWLAGDRAIPDGVRVRIEQIEDYTAEQVGRYAETLQDAAGEPGIVTHRTDAELWAANPGLHPLPVSWHWQVCARVAHEIVGLQIAYADDARRAAAEDCLSSAKSTPPLSGCGRLTGGAESAMDLI